MKKFGIIFVSVFPGLPNFRRGISPAAELKPTDVKTVLKEIAIERKCVTLGELMLEGIVASILLFLRLMIMATSHIKYMYSYK